MSHAFLKFASGLVLMAVLSPSVLAAEEPATTYVVDSELTRVTFAVDNFGWGDIDGTFGDVAGTITFDAEAVERSLVSVRIASASLDTGHRLPNSLLRSGVFFDVDDHPEVIFESTGIVIEGANRGTMTGALTIRGVTRSVTLDVSHAESQEAVRFEAVTEIDRRDFGMRPGIPGIGRIVSINISLIAVRP